MKKLVITLDESTTSNYFDMCEKIVSSEVAADCCPSGVTLSVVISPMTGFPSDVYLKDGDSETLIGEAEVEIYGG